MKHIKILSAITITALLAGCAADTAVSMSEAETTEQTSATVTEATSQSTTASTTASAATAEPVSDDTPTVETDEARPVTTEAPVAPDPEADKIVEEREENIPMASTEEAEQHQQEREELQDMAENTQAYTTEGIPLTSDGDLTAPAKPTAGYKLPEGAQLEFTGDPSTAIYTELPDGCYWTPVPAYPNAFTDPAGNRWMNTKSGTTDGTGNSGEGYLTPDGKEHPSQAEIDRAIAFNQASQERHENGPTNFENAQASEEDLAALDALRR